MNLVEHKLLKADSDTPSLSAKVNKHIADGWQLNGGRFIRRFGRQGYILCQEMVKYKKEVK